MRITKYAHCSMMVEVDNLKILTDPGMWSELDQLSIQDLDLILITHEHADHLHIDALHKILKNNPKARVITNSSVGKLLSEQKIDYEILEDGEHNSFSNIKIAAFGTTHAQIYEDLGLVANTGYFIADKLFYPGDAFTNPKKPVELLALPVAGPWLNIKQSINYAKELAPKKAFPVHDAMLKFPGPFHALPQKVLQVENIEFVLPDTNAFNITLEI